MSEPDSTNPKVQRLRAWVIGALVGDAGFEESEAELAFERCRAKYVEHDRYVEHLRSESVEAVTAARATALCSGGPAWWRDRGARAREFMLEGRFVEGSVRQAEELAGPWDFDVDFNWPAQKLFRVVDVPTGYAVGDTVIAGDGEGNRERMVVVERDGRLGLVGDRSTFENPTEDLGHIAWNEAEKLISDTYPN